VLAQHSASLKQVRFQPGAANNSVIATSSRDGSVQIWDLRCKGTERPVLGIHVTLDPSIPSDIGVRKSNITYGCVVNSIYNAHRPALYGRLSQPAVTREGPSRGEAHGRIGDVSVTAITFLPGGREHMLLTASEANASVKLWDLRSLHNTRRKLALPLSCTAQPDSHSQWRNFGINSLNLGGDGSRFYALCKDNTVYVYSTAHLILGHAPELSSKTTSRRRQPVDVHESLGPLYGFRHPQLHATSFYVKSAIRAAKAGKCEMLAVGSCDGCTLLFPTDERYLEQQQRLSRSQNPVVAGVRRNASHMAEFSQYPDSIPISERGTPLIRGHDREVGALSWTSEGELVTVGDDFLVRCWREGDSARKVRINGEQGGQRWGCGWANVPELYDSNEADE
jgi:WD40 repeat protein